MPNAACCGVTGSQLCQSSEFHGKGELRSFTSCSTHHWWFWRKIFAGNHSQVALALVTKNTSKNHTLITQEKHISNTRTIWWKQSSESNIRKSISSLYTKLACFILSHIYHHITVRWEMPVFKRQTDVSTWVFIAEVICKCVATWWICMRKAQAGELSNNCRHAMYLHSMTTKRCYFFFWISTGNVGPLNIRHKNFW